MLFLYAPVYLHLCRVEENRRDKTFGTASNSVLTKKNWIKVCPGGDRRMYEVVFKEIFSEEGTSDRRLEGN